MRTISRPLGVLLTIGAVALLSCGKSAGPKSPDAPAAQQSGNLPVAEFGLPAPSTLLNRLAPWASPPEAEFSASRQASYSYYDLFKFANSYKTTLPNQRVSMTLGQTATFEPAWTPDTPDFTGVSYAMYDYTIEGYQGDPSINPHSRVVVPASTSLYYGLANWSADRWDWFAGDGPQPATVVAPSFGPYLAFGGKLLLVVMVLGTEPVELAHVRIGSQPPNVYLTSDVLYGNAPLTVDFTVTGDDPDGTIEEYRWDLDGDGIFELSTGAEPTLTREFTEPGTFTTRVRAFDNDNVYTQTHRNNWVYPSSVFSVGTPGGNEVITGAVINSVGEATYYGYRRVGTNNAVLRLNTDGEYVNLTTWDGPGNDQASGVTKIHTQAESDTACLFGSTDSYGAGAFDGLLQLWFSYDGLVESWAIGQSDSDEMFYAAAGDPNSGAIYVCGEQYVPSLNRSFGVVLRFNHYNGSVVWARTIISPTNSSLRDLKLGPDGIHVCGAYNVAVGDSAALYAHFDVNGNLLSARTLGLPADSESAASLMLDDNGTPWLSGSIARSGGNYRTFIGMVDGPATELASTGALQLRGLGLLKTARAPFTLVMHRRPTVTESSIVVADLDSSLLLLNAFELSALPGGNCQPHGVLAYGSDGLLIVGGQTGPTPVVGTTGVTTTAAAMTWETLTPAVGSPPLTVTPTLTGTNTVFGEYGFDRGATDGDALISLTRHVP